MSKSSNSSFSGAGDPSSTTSGPPPLSDAEARRRQKLVEDSTQRLDVARQRLTETNIQSENGLVTGLRFTGAHDQVMKKIYQWAARMSYKKFPQGRTLSLAALGGYGRRQLNLHSDIDLLFLLPPEGVERAELELRYMIYLLFDLRLDLGYVARTIEQAVDHVGADFDSTTALIDARWLAGDRSLFDEMRGKLRRRLHEERKRWFFREILDHRNERHEKQGASVYLLEPNLKEGEGGLRDLHSMGWLSYILFGDSRLRAMHQQGIWTPKQLRDARDGRSFLLRMRNELHAMEGRRVDVLRQPRANDLALRMGYEGDEVFLAEELLLRDYYQHARAIYNATESAVNKLARAGQGMFRGVVERIRSRRIASHVMALGSTAYVDDKSDDWLRRSPRNLFRVAAIIASHELKFSERTKTRMMRAAEKIDDNTRRDPKVRDSFMAILKGPKHIAYTLRVLHEIEALDSYLPEWSHLFCLVRADLYHSYTVDEHHLKCIEAMERLRENLSEEDLRVRAAAEGIERWDILAFSLLLHDVGKGMGGAHALLGAQMADRIALRINLTDSDRALLRFLVLNHLKMSHTAQRRDLHDDSIIETFAQEIGDVTRLRMLYIHTICDMRGVGPNVYNDWRAQLLGMLFERAEMVLEGRELTAANTRRSHPLWREVMMEKLADLDPRADEVEDFLDSLPDRYYLAVTPDRAATHYRLIRGLDREKRIDWQLAQPLDRNYTELLVSCYDKPGVFSNICGALASKQINILSAQINTTSDGYGVNVFQITNDQYERLPQGFRMDRVLQSLNDALHGRIDIVDLIRASRTATPLTTERLEHRPTRVEVLNDVSTSHTIFEIHAHDRPGLLYDVTRSLFEMNLSIELALITTSSYHVVDVLYVMNTEGDKIHEQKELEAIVDRILSAVEEGAAERIEA